MCYYSLIVQLDKAKFATKKDYSWIHEYESNICLVKRFARQYLNVFLLCSTEPKVGTPTEKFNLKKKETT